MNRAHRDDTLLRTLDPAPSPPADAERERAAATLERILASPPSAGNGASATLPRRGTARARRLRWALVPLGALALIGGVALTPNPGPDASAYASWTPTPSAPDPQSLALADDACRADLRRSGNARSGDPSLDVDRASTDLADRRGDFVAIVYWTPDPDLAATCIVYNPRGSDEVDVVSSAEAGSSGPAQIVPADGFFPGGYFDSTGPEPTGLARLLDPGPFFHGSVTSGSVGRDVVGVTVHAGTFTTEASVAEGRYGAWWPGPAVECAPQKTGVLRCDPLMTYDLHLADGTTTTDAKPLPPR